MRRAPAKPGVCAVCECVARLPSRNMSCLRTPCAARSREDSSHFTVPFSQPCALQGTLHLISRHTLATLDTQQTFTQRSFYTQKPETFAHRSFYTEKLLHRKALPFCVFFSPFQPFMLYAFCQDLVVTATSSGIGPYFQGRSAHLYRL